MKSKSLVIVLGAACTLWLAQSAQAGAIRYAGKKIGKGSAQVASVTASGVQATAEGVTTAGKATGGVVKTGAVAVGKGAAATPGLVVRGTKAGVKAIARAIW